ncbi:MAG TPA: carbamoyltransferase [Nitrospirales bacterium]
MIVLGISAFYHDSAAAIVRDGEIVAAAQEERFTRRKHDESFPAGAVTYCLQEAGLNLGQVDFVAFYEKPLLTFNRLLETYIAFSPSGLPSFVKAIPVWVKEKIFLKSTLIKELNALQRGSVTPDRVIFGFHHHSHAASAFYPSPFKEAAILVMDGVGEWATTSLGKGFDNKVELMKEIRFPHSLGLLYSAFTYYLGFKVNEGEYKVMGLAPYGEPTFTKTISDNLIDVKSDGSFRLDLSYFNYCTGLTMTKAKFHALFDGPPRKPDAPLTQRHMDLACSVQRVLEEIVLRLANSLHRQTGSTNLCLAGGVSLNCVANGLLLRQGPFERIWVQPAAGDAGGALGVALAVTYDMKKLPRSISGNSDEMKGTYLGPQFDRETIRQTLDLLGAVYRELSDEQLYPEVVQALTQGKVVGWFQGRMEFGPRALGNRSILADPRLPHMQQTVNRKVKYREGFRPFAPAVLREEAGEFFNLNCESPYMLLVAQVHEKHMRVRDEREFALRGFDKLKVMRSDIPAVTHVDGSARVQTVDEATNPRFHRLLTAFRQSTGQGVLVNTSFNVRDEPIVCSPEDAYRCFMGTELDMLVLGNCVLHKTTQS